jgi:general secretion pathway protein H
MRIVFGREPVDRPFVLTLASGELRASIRADGVGHFTVDQ